MEKEKIIQVCKNYLISLGIDEERIDNDFKDIYQIYFNHLSKVCILKENRNGGGNQTHIHITGLESGMRFFYDKKILENITSKFSEDIKEELYIYSENLLDLNERVKKKLGVDKKLNIIKSKDLVKTYTFKKIGRIGTKSIQVQLSKTTKDDEQFMNLRRCLFEDDGLAFFKKTDGKIIVVGIPKKQLDDMNIKSKNYYEEVEVPLDNSNNLNTFRKVDCMSIASYSPNDEENSLDNIVDLSEGIHMRKLRTERHQDIVKLLAIDLERKGYELYEYPVDCLAIIEGKKGMLFEIKTLDGTASDEKKQVLKAFAQLCYYEMFYVSKKFDIEIEKFVFFEHKVSQEHISFFKKYGIQVLWLNENRSIENENGMFVF